MVRETFNDVYKNTYYEGDSIIRGHYYDLLRLRSQTYYFNNGTTPDYVYSHIVCASKFVIPPTLHSVKGNHPTYELLNEILQFIK